MKTTMNHFQTIVGARGLALCLACFMMLMSVLPMISQAQATIVAPGAITNPTATTSQIDIVGPAGSGRFGTSVTALPNGNIVVTDPSYDITSPVTIVDVGAVYLYNGATGALISKLTGSAAGDQVGLYGVLVLSNGNYVVSSPLWNNGAIKDAGAVSWCNGVTGINGPVSAANSLVGSTAGDLVGLYGVTALANGNYVVNSSLWDNGAIADAGASTWGNGATGSSGPVSSSNSLVGSTANDQVGSGGVTALANSNYVVSSPLWNNGAIVVAGAVTWGNGATGISGPVSAANSLVGSTAYEEFGNNDVTVLSNGNYVVSSPLWNNGAIGAAGAVTWGNGATGISGVVSAANSLVGSTANDLVGSDGVTALANGNYVVNSSFWNNGALSQAGAATWGNGTTGISGPVSAANSLVGSNSFDRVGSGGVTVLSNGNYVVSSSRWKNGGAASAGAVTWGNATTGISGPISPSNSLVGSIANDQVGSDGVTALANGNYVVGSPAWDNGAIDAAGAATWGNGATGISGPVSPSNSLVGSIAHDFVGVGVTALTNGNYVVRSPLWDNGAIVNAGAVTWSNGTTGSSGPVSSANSLVGSSTNDRVGSDGVTALSNGNYVVRSQSWDNGAIADAGAATWGNGTTGISGPVSPANSLVGSSTNDRVGSDGVTALANGSYVVSSPSWNKGATCFAGAVTWGNGATGISGVVSAANSLVGSAENDRVGFGHVTALANGNYVVRSHIWDNGAIVDAGAITFGIGNRSTVGPITAANSVRGTAPFGGPNMGFDYDYVNRQLVVGRPDSNIVTLFRVMEFDVCLQDDSNPTTAVAFNTLTGDYIFCAGGTQYKGTGTVTRRGSTTTLQHNASDRRVLVSLDASANRATGSFQKLGAGGGIFSLTDRDIRNDTCACATQ